MSRYAATLNTTKTPKDPSRSRAALNMRSSCVLGFTSPHTNAQSAIISAMRNIKMMVSLNIGVLYPILTGGVKRKIAHFNKRPHKNVEKFVVLLSWMQF